jgi:hypothetical protein
MAKRTRKGITYYLVRWSGDYDPTWEPASNIPENVIKEYERLTGGFRRR